jgi:hypothetical protein
MGAMNNWSQYLRWSLMSDLTSLSKTAFRFNVKNVGHFDFVIFWFGWMK